MTKLEGMRKALLAMDLPKHIEVQALGELDSIERLLKIRRDVLVMHMSANNRLYRINTWTVGALIVALLGMVIEFVLR